MNWTVLILGILFIGFLVLALEEIVGVNRDLHNRAIKLREDQLLLERDKFEHSKTIPAEKPVDEEDEYKEYIRQQNYRKAVDEYEQ